MPRARLLSDEQEQEIVALYGSDGWHTVNLAKRYGVSPGLISKTLAKHSVALKRRGSKRVKDRHGYIKVWVDIERDELGAAMTLGDSSYVSEHRLIMARSLGRPLRSDETVHHINGDRSDNRIENLQLRSGRHGKGAAFVCMDCNSHNVQPVPIA